MSSRKIYRELCATEPTIPFFSRDWWLDAVCGGAERWDVAIVEKGGNVVASMPYYVKRKYGFTLVTQPSLTQTLGPWLRPSKAKYANALAEQKDLMQSLIDQLPAFDYFVQNWNYTNSNWLPFYWRDFRQTTKYTYILSDLSDEDMLWSGIQGNIRREIRKAENRFSLRVRDDIDIDGFLQLNRLTFERQGRSLPYSEGLVRQVDAACEERQCRKIWIAQDPQGRHHAGVYIVWDESSAYYIMGGGDPELRNSGASSLCMWHAIRHGATVTHRFDFEGSMLESVERFFRAYGAVQTPYFSISKTPSRLLRTREAMKGIIKQG